MLGDRQSEARVKAHVATKATAGDDFHTRLFAGPRATVEEEPASLAWPICEELVLMSPPVGRSATIAATETRFQGGETWEPRHK